MNSASALDPTAVISQQGALHQNQRVIIIYSSSSAAPRPTLSNCNASPPPSLTTRSAPALLPLRATDPGLLFQQIPSPAQHLLLLLLLSTLLRLLLLYVSVPALLNEGVKGCSQRSRKGSRRRCVSVVCGLWRGVPFSMAAVLRKIHTALSGGTFSP